MAGTERAGVKRADQRSADRAGEPAAAVPGWVVWSTLGLTLVGLAVSGYLTYEHFTTESSLVCPNQGGLNCESVTTSAQSKLFGIPVALLGLAYFVGLLVVLSPPAWRVGDPRLRTLLNLARLAATGGGLGYVLYLIYAELFLIRSICIWCTVVHVVTFLLFGIIAFWLALSPPAPDPRRR